VAPRANTGQILRALAGPTLIVLASLVAMHGYAFGGRLSAYPDDLSFWMPNYCYLGQALHSGHIPLWNPTTLAGTRFAADPQTGWMYLPVMILFTLLPCGTAMRWFIALQPIGAGLGLFWFLRSEGISRPAATIGGLALALPIAASIISLSIPFTGTFAWTALTLAAASRCMHARAWPSRLLWLLATAAAWGQLAAAHFSVGLLIGSAALAAYVSARAAIEFRSQGGRASLRVAGTAGLLAGSLLLVNAAYLLPRLAYVSTTSLGLGYARLQTLSVQLWGHPGTARVSGPAIGPNTPLGFAGTPGLYVGALVLALVFAGMFSKQLRPLAIAFSAYGLVFYLLAQKFGVRHLGPHVASTRPGDLYLHQPHWLAFSLILILPLLGAIGIEAWLRSSSLRTRLLMLTPGLFVWWVLPLVVGRYHAYTVLFAAGTLAAVVGLATVIRRPRLAPILAVFLCLELITNLFVGEAKVRPPLGAVWIGSRPAPRLDPGAFLTPGPIALAIADAPGRYLSIVPEAWTSRGLQTRQSDPYWPLLAMQQSMTFGLRSAQGYDPVQELGYWEFVRAAGHVQLLYNVSYFKRVKDVALDLLQVSDVIARNGRPPVPGATVVATEGLWADYRIPDPSPLASLIPSWSIEPTTETAVVTVARAQIQPDQKVLLDREPSFAGSTRGPDPAGSAGTTSVVARDAQRIVLAVEAPQPSIVLLRQPYDVNWHPSVDGRPVPLLRADGFLQAIAVGSGRHTIEVRYTERTVGLGLLVSLIAVVLLLGAAFLVARRRRRAAGGDVQIGNDPSVAIGGD
jgi:hypothetical protein